MNWIESSLKPIFEKYKAESLLIASAFAVTLISGVIILASNASSNKPEEDIPKIIKKETITKPGKSILVDLSGAVERSDVYEVSSGARLKDILILAGGLSQDADRDYFTKNFNLARTLQDQEKIYIPNQEETESGEIRVMTQLQSAAANNVLGASEKININSASVEQLDTLPGIGLVTAKKIIQNRPYNSLEELMDKKSVGKSVFEKIKELIQI